MGLGNRRYPSEDEPEARGSARLRWRQAPTPPFVPVFRPPDARRCSEQSTNCGCTFAVSGRESERARERGAGEELRARKLCHPAEPDPTGYFFERGSHLASVDYYIDLVRRHCHYSGHAIRRRSFEAGFGARQHVKEDFVGAGREPPGQWSEARLRSRHSRAAGHRASEWPPASSRSTDRARLLRSYARMLRNR